jgi:SAM-dependent methyltransferase
MKMDQQEDLIGEQIAYYRARAREYDEWFLRQGRYDHGPEHKRLWFAEVEQVQEALRAAAPYGRVLELACGTGLWTQVMLPHASQLTGLDASPEMIALNRGRLGPGMAHYLEADLFEWSPDQVYDFVFFAFWLSHVPPERFKPFWDVVRASLAPGGRVFFVDSRYDPTSTARDMRLGAQGDTTLSRRLNDGREFTIVKVYYEPNELSARLVGLGWSVDVQETAHYFLYGEGRLGK